MPWTRGHYSRRPRRTYTRRGRMSATTIALVVLAIIVVVVLVARH
jgi:hypothetical protein